MTTQPAEQCVDHDCERLSAWERDSGLAMTDFAEFEYSGKQVVRAGEALKGTIDWSDDHRDEQLRVFRIANNWRESHAYPMYRMRHQLRGRMRSARIDGITVARLKRMPSIRRKLRRQPQKLNQIQDLGGCRAVVPSILDARRLVQDVRDNYRHEFNYEDDYIGNPKVGGYRSHHLIYKYTGDGADEVFNGRRIEMQIRTRLQHCWATAVEAVGLVRQEDMKGGEGDSDWLRLFELMSAEFAMAEQCPEPERISSHSERVREIKDLERKLLALSTLENLRQAVKFTDTYVYYPTEQPKCFRIDYDHAKQEVRVTPHTVPRTLIQAYEDVEMTDSQSGNGNINTVFVDADRIEVLKEAYPNYFGDVQLFCRNLEEITRGRAAREYTMPPQRTAPPPPKEAPDLSWFRRPKRWS